MLTTELGIVMFVRFIQFWNAPSPILATELPIVTSVRSDSANAFFPIEVTELGIIRLPRPEHLANASSLMEVTASGMVKPLRLEQPSNAFSPIEVIELGMVTVVKLLQKRKVPFGILVKELLKTTLVRPEHSWKTSSPIVVTAFGMIIVFRFEHL